MIFNIVSGGGGSCLNFAIAGNPRPENPDENTIWIDTDEPISGWTISAEEPAKVENTVWIAAGSFSQVAFNALKENCIMVYPLSAKQCLGGSWVSKTAQSWQDGKWVDWFRYLYNRGDECIDLTGGWIAKSWKMAENAGDAAQTYNIEKNDDNLRFTKTGLIGAVMHTVYKIDLTNVKTINFKGKMYPGLTNDYWTAFYVWENINGRYWNSNAVKKELCEAGSIKTNFSMDVSDLDGEYFVGFGIYDASCYVEVEELYMEVTT